MPNQKPWLKFYKNVPETIDYPRVTMYEALMQTVEKNPDRIAYDFSITPQHIVSLPRTSIFVPMRWPPSV